MLSLNTLQQFQQQTLSQTAFKNKVKHKLNLKNSSCDRVQTEADVTLKWPSKVSQLRCGVLNCLEGIFLCTVMKAAAGAQTGKWQSGEKEGILTVVTLPQLRQNNAE